MGYHAPNRASLRMQIHPMADALFFRKFCFVLLQQHMAKTLSDDDDNLTARERYIPLPFIVLV